MPRQTLVWMRPISRPPLWPDENIWNQFRRHECIALAYLCRQVEGERNGQKPVGLIVGVPRLSGFALSQGSDAAQARHSRLLRPHFLSTRLQTIPGRSWGQAAAELIGGATGRKIEPGNEAAANGVEEP